MTDRINAYANFISEQLKNSDLVESHDNVTVDDGGHKITLHRGESKPGHSDTYTVHHPDGSKKKATISYDKHSNEDDEIDHKKVNSALGLAAGHKIGKKIANGMNGMSGGYKKFED